MNKWGVLFILLCVVWACDKKEEDEPSEPRYVVLTQVSRHFNMLGNGSTEMKEYKEVYSYNSYGYENGCAFYEDGVKVEERGNYRHDELGRVVYWETALTDGTKGFFGDYSYTPSGKLSVERKVYFTKEEGGVEKEPLIYKTEYSYNGQDLENRVFAYMNDELNYKRDNYQYNAAGQLLAFDEFDKNGNLRATYRDTYDPSGRLLKSEIVMKIIEWSSVYEYTYDSSGRVASMKTYSDGKYDGETKDYRYDEAGNKLSSKAYDAAGNLMSELEYTYQKFE